MSELTIWENSLVSRRIHTKRIARMCLWLFAIWAFESSVASAADYNEALKNFHQGRYEESAKIAAAEVERGIWSERWPRLLIQCQLAKGRYSDALEVYQNSVKRYPTSIALRHLGLDVLRYNNLLDEVTKSETELARLIERSFTGYITRENLIAAGRFLTSRGEDARKVLQLFYDRVIDRDPEFLEAYVATAELAITKGDYQVASETVQQAAKLNSGDPRLDYLMARALESSDSQAAAVSLQRVLSQNPDHAEALRMLAEQAIDRERYEAAEDLLREVLLVNVHDSLAWALFAVIAHVRGEYELEQLHRAAALSTWSQNPDVDHLIGLKLSQKYRFAEGAEYQRRALTMDPDHVAANFQLAQDLLRLGDEQLGWRIAKDVGAADPYNVVAFNLLTLQDRVKDYSVLERDGIRVRMQSKEAAVYGDRVLDCLCDAKRELCEKYQVDLTEEVSVEIFPKQSDFAIRTFGLPGGDGYLGVCFGRVITANSPASQGERPSNWQSVLWHEFCHAVTLEKTRNRMPRWLSEGISVYEERERNSAWGESMTPRYREMLLDEKLTPVSDLSAAFLSPPSPLHLQFAYFQSSLVIEFLIEKHGLDSLLMVLDDLAAGLPINDALVRSVGSLGKLDHEFAKHAKQVARQLGPTMDWSRDDLPEKAGLGEWAGWLRMHPTNYWGLRSHAELSIDAKRWADAKRSLQTIDQLGAMTSERNGPLEWLADVCAKIGDEQGERRVLERIVRTSSDALPTLRRLLALDEPKQRWSEVWSHADQALSVHPLLPEFHDAYAEAAEQLGRSKETVAALKALEALDPLDAAENDFRLARVYQQMKENELAKRHVLRALEYAPRYREAHRLLLELTSKQKQPNAKGAETP